MSEIRRLWVLIVSFWAVFDAIAFLPTVLDLGNQFDEGKISVFLYLFQFVFFLVGIPAIITFFVFLIWNRYRN